jgi:hypothetical protein
MNLGDGPAWVTTAMVIIMAKLFITAMRYVSSPSVNLVYRTAANGTPEAPTGS